MENFACWQSCVSKRSQLKKKEFEVKFLWIKRTVTAFDQTIVLELSQSVPSDQYQGEARQIIVDPDRLQ